MDRSEAIARHYWRQQLTASGLIVLVVVVLWAILMPGPPSPMTAAIDRTRHLLRCAKRIGGTQKSEEGAFPASWDALRTFARDKTTARDCHCDEDTFKEIVASPHDIWGNAFRFGTRTEGEYTESTITSAGPDGEFGTRDDIQEAW